ncbi:MAG: hypothetical protein R2843_15875 [Thermomicrobiales bacterium]
MAPSGTRLAYEIGTDTRSPGDSSVCATVKPEALPDIDERPPIAPMVGLRWLVFGVTAIVAQNQGWPQPTRSISNAGSPSRC